MAVSDEDNYRFSVNAVVTAKSINIKLHFINMKLYIHALVTVNSVQAFLTEKKTGKTVGKSTCASVASLMCLWSAHELQYFSALNLPNLISSLLLTQSFRLRFLICQCHNKLLWHELLIKYVEYCSSVCLRYSSDWKVNGKALYSWI